MPAVIVVENLGKRYLLSHQGRPASYLALRDVLSDGVRRMGRRLLNPAAPREGQGREEFWALKDVSLEVQQGERVGIIGRNGAGKSTLLKILSRITEPSTGSVRLRGRVASLLEVGTGFHPELSGRENIFLNGAILGMGRAEIRRKFDEIVDFAEVERFLDTPVKHYSSGMYVRLAFAVAAHLEPEILIVDEVLAVGDAQFQRKCLGKMEDVGREGRTVLFVSHNMAAVRRLCSKAVLLSAGSVICQGESETVVPAYLKMAEAPARSAVSRDEDAGKAHQILSVCVRNAGGGGVDRPLEVDEPFTVTVCCRLSTPLPGGYATLEIKNQHGEYVLFSDNRDHPGSARFEQAGLINTSIPIPAPLLTPGKYTVAVSIGRPPLGMVDEIRDAAVLEIEDTRGVRVSRPGAIYLPLEWHQE